MEEENERRDSETMTFSRYIACVVLGMMVAAGSLWWRVDTCRNESPTKLCAISVDGSGVKLAIIEWPNH